MKAYRIYLLFSLLIGFAFPTEAQIAFTREDTVIFHRFLKYAEQGDADMTRTARFFMNSPYVGGTLEGDSAERLRINLREFDCVTFAENATALYLMLQSGDRSFENFCRILQRIRYRGGVADGYLSRLHYTCDWLSDNVRKGVVSLPKFSRCQNYAPAVSFMSTHCDKYPALKDRPDWCADMAKTEQRINSLRFCFIPKEQVNASESEFRNGDIIAITTHIPGLDVAHVGFAAVQNGKVYLLHASTEAKKVVVTDETLSEYLMRRKNHSGIIVARVL